jgi:hypothetical protein
MREAPHAELELELRDRQFRLFGVEENVGGASPRRSRPFCRSRHFKRADCSVRPPWKTNVEECRLERVALFAVAMARPSYEGALCGPRHRAVVGNQISESEKVSGRRDLNPRRPPWQGGGGMSDFNELAGLEDARRPERTSEDAGGPAGFPHYSLITAQFPHGSRPSPGRSSSSFWKGETR